VLIFWRRWLFLVLGGALFTPYAIFAVFAVPLTVPSLASPADGVFVSVATAVILPAIAATSLLPAVRAFEGVLAPLLLGGPATDLVIAPADTWAEQARTTLWYLLHTIIGAVISLASVVTPTIVILMLSSWMRGDAVVPVGDREISISQGWAPFLALGLVMSLVAAIWGAGAAAAQVAPRLLGPGPAAKLAELERRTAELTERNRLARELHDSIGHALTVTTLQAGAARTVLRTDVGFVEQALLAIEQTGRTAAAELDDFLGLLREDATARAPQPSLRDVEMLVGSHRKAGLPVTLSVEGDLAAVPSVVSREVYRIVQEGLTNVQRHSGAVPTEVRLAVVSEELTAEVQNAAVRKPRARRGRGGGHGLDGIRERVRLLGGRVEAGENGDGWRLLAVVPTRARR
jgi:signal transduction histidine kinase